MMKRKNQPSYKKLFKKISKKISGLFSKKKIVRHHKKRENKYISLLKNIFKNSKKTLNKTKKLKNAKIFIWSFVFLFLSLTIISLVTENSSKKETVPNINYDFMHWSAASWRDFLFEWETGHDSNLTINDDQENQQPLYIWTMNTTNTWTIQTWGRETFWSGTITQNTSWSKTNTWIYPSTWININTWVVTWSNIDTPTISENPNVIILPVEISKYLIRKLKEQIKQQRLLAETVKKDCISPRNTTVKNWDFIMAYQQRTDVNNLCNVEKRYCNDWLLWGTYSQEKCNENTKYEYQTAEVKSYIEKPNDLFVQPKKPINNSATFSTDWKINTSNTSNTNRWYSESWAKIINEKETWLKYISNPSDCKDPRWNVIKNWQFVTAYKTPVGFIDLECKSEYRYCTDWKLGWSYSYKECNYKDITYNDYLVWNTDTDKATALDLIQSIDPEDETDSENIRNKIQSLFR